MQIFLVAAGEGSSCPQGTSSVVSLGVSAGIINTNICSYFFALTLFGSFYP